MLQTVTFAECFDQNCVSIVGDSHLALNVQSTVKCSQLFDIERPVNREV